MNDIEHLIEKLESARAAGDREQEHMLLDEVGDSCFAIHEYQKSLHYYEEQLRLGREMGMRSSEAETLNTIALVYDALGEPQRAIEMLQEALPIVREMQDRQGEASTLNDMALVYQDLGDARQSLDLLQQALTIRRDLQDEIGEATTLSNMAGIYHAIGEAHHALSLYRQALPVFQRLQHRAGEATTLNNMALVYRNIGETSLAMELLDQVLPIRRDMEDRVEEANALTCMASVLLDMERYGDALAAFEQSIAIEREVGNYAGEAAGLVGAARLLYRHLDQRDQAVAYMEQAVAALDAGGLEQDFAGHTTEMLRQVLDTMRRNGELAVLQEDGDSLSDEQLQQIVGNTIAVMTVAQDKRAEWRTAMMGALQHARLQEPRWNDEVDFFEAVLAMLDGQTPHLAEDHCYVAALVEIRRGIKVGKARVVTVRSSIDDPTGEIGKLHEQARGLRDSGKYDQAKALYEQVLVLCQQQGDAGCEAMTLCNLAELFHATGESSSALDYYQHALSIYQDVGVRDGEAATLNSIARLYRNMGQPHHALGLFEQSLPICQEIGDRAGEAGTLSGLASVLMDLGRYSEAIEKFEQSAEIERELGNHAGVSAGLIGAARLLYRHLNERERAVGYMDDAIAMLERSGLSQDAAGHTTAMLRHVAATMRHNLEHGGAGDKAETMSAEQLEQMVMSTITVMTIAQDKRAEWYAAMEGARRHAEEQGPQWFAEVEFFTAVMAILDGRKPKLPDDHLYAGTVQEILDNVGSGGAGLAQPTVEVVQAVDDLVNAGGVDARRQVLAAQEMLLLRPDAELLLERRLGDARVSGDGATVQDLEEVLGLVREQAV